ncbi:hypothetical protein L9F63_026198 [Diploptera punctata]|uniref:Negative elongation factor A n=1 Tax=Diploptera punctata TaxID=6984 RepID=A0AAD8ALZ4_DIPPU|nr:hypothetical protein L9F63_026198 [Diploptera punctata]
MANVRDSDTSLWLHNKLGTSNDSWTGGSILIFLFLQFSGALNLDEILEVAQVDSEQWVSMCAEIMKTLPSHWISQHRYWAELMQKSADAASNLKKSTAPTVPIQQPLKGIPSRVPPGGFPISFLSSPSMSRPPMPRTPAGRKDGGIKLLDINEQPLGYAQAKKRKKMQELEEAKKASEAATAQQVLEQQNQQHSVTTIITIPRDVAVVKMPAKGVKMPSKASTTPVSEATPSAQTVVATTSAPTQPSYAPLVNAAPFQTVATPPKQMIQIRPTQQVTQIRIQPVGAAPNSTLQRKGLSLTHCSIGDTLSSSSAVFATVNFFSFLPEKKLTVMYEREQMLEAQEMFRTANKVTRPEKALILGFMAGSRDNPCPHLGNIVTIKLSENQENVMQGEDPMIATTVETHFQMNYNTGEWKRIKKYRRLEDPASATA